MEFNNFALSSTKIKSNWFDGEKKSIFNQIGKEEGLNLYLQLFRFRLHQFVGSPKQNYENHIFRITIGELKKFTKINYKSRLRNKQVFEMLKDMSKAGIIKLHKPTRWDYLLDESDKIKPDNLIVLQATDVPHTHVEQNEKGQEVDKPDDENEDYYVPINFNTINYMYNDLKFTSKEVAAYLLLMKLSNGGRSEAFMNINKMKELLGIGNDKVTEIIITLNKNYMVASYSRHIGKKVSFYHTPVRSYDHINQFKEETKDTIHTFLKRYNKAGNDHINQFKEETKDTIHTFLKRYNKAGNDNFNPFDEVADDVIDSDEWGQSTM